MTAVSTGCSPIILWTLLYTFDGNGEAKRAPSSIFRIAVRAVMPIRGAGKIGF